MESDERQQISTILSDVDIWLSSCRDGIAAPTTDPSMSLRSLLSRVRLIPINFFVLASSLHIADGLKKAVSFLGTADAPVCIESVAES